MSVRQMAPTESMERLVPLTETGEPLFTHTPIYVFHLDEDPARYADEDGYITFRGNWSDALVRCKVRYVAELTEIGGRLILPGVWVVEWPDVCSHGVPLFVRCDQCRAEHPEWLSPE